MNQELTVKYVPLVGCLPPGTLPTDDVLVQLMVASDGTVQTAHLATREAFGRWSPPVILEVRP